MLVRWSERASKGVNRIKGAYVHLHDMKLCVGVFLEEPLLYLQTTVQCSWWYNDLGTSKRQNSSRLPSYSTACSCFTQNIHTHIKLLQEVPWNSQILNLAWQLWSVKPTTNGTSPLEQFISQVPCMFWAVFGLKTAKAKRAREGRRKKIGRR